MALARDLTGPSASDPPVLTILGKGRVRGRFASPVTVFVILSVVFGLAALFANPPLRGPDESAHFLRVFGISDGDIIPSTQDERGRKGLLIPAALYDDYKFFETERQKFGTRGFNYWTVFDEYQRRRGARTAGKDERPPVFVPYNGSEAYSPAPYIPYIVAVAIGRILGLDFLGLLYLMRIVGFFAMTAVAAYAIAIVPHLKWTFVLVAMLPSVLFGRTAVGADGATLSFTLVGTALCLWSACQLSREGLWKRATFMTLCSLSKPPQIAFLVMEFFAHPLHELRRRLGAVALVVLPGLILTALWVTATSADVGTWRVVDGTNTPGELFEPKRKLLLLLNHPLHFPALVMGSLGAWDVKELWRQLIGVLGWLDTGLRDWVYPTISGLLVASCFAPLPLAPAKRYQIAAASVLTFTTYVFAVYFIFYMTWTPVDADWIWGVQGRYFVVLLAPMALTCAALVNWGPGEMTRSAIAICGATLSGAAVVDALIRANW